MMIRNAKRTTVTAILATAFAVASVGASAMSPSEHDTMTREELERLRGEERGEDTARSEAPATGWKWVDVGGKVGEIRLRIREQ